MSTKSQFKIPISGTSTGATTTTIASFDFATAAPGGQNLDNAIVCFSSFIPICNNSFANGAYFRLDAVHSRLSGTISLISQISSFGSTSVSVQRGDSTILNGIQNVNYVISGTQVQLRVVTNLTAGSFIYGGIMRGVTEA